MLSYYLKVAVHNTRRSRVLAALMVLAIAAGIGASMTTLTVMHLLSGDPLPGRSGEIYYPQVDVDPQSKGREPYDVMDYHTAYELWQARRADQQTMVAESQVKLRAPDAPVPASMLSLGSVTSDFFSMFQVPFRYGRGWRPEDDAGRSRVAVISSGLNDGLFGGRDSVGKTVRLGEADVRIVGVLANWRPSPVFYKVRGGRFSNGDTADFYGKPDDVFVPFSTGLDVNEGHFQPFTCWAKNERPGHLEDAPCVWVALWVRLGSARAVADYRRFLDGYAAQQKSLGRIGHADDTRLRPLMGWLEFNRVVPGDVKLQALLAFGFLFICLTNVVGLLLAKFMRYGADIGLRRALGATRRAIFLQCLMESALIGLLGGVGGMGLTLLGLHMVRLQSIPYADLAHLDASMFFLTFAASLATSLLAGVFPALRASLTPAALQLKLV